MQVKLWANIGDKNQAKLCDNKKNNIKNKPEYGKIAHGHLNKCHYLKLKYKIFLSFMHSSLLPEESEDIHTEKIISIQYLT